MRAMTHAIFGAVTCLRTPTAMLSWRKNFTREGSTEGYRCNTQIPSWRLSNSMPEEFAIACWMSRAPTRSAPVARLDKLVSLDWCGVVSALVIVA